MINDNKKSGLLRPLSYFKHILNLFIVLAINHCFTNLGFVASWLYLVHRECHLEKVAKPFYNSPQGY